MRSFNRCVIAGVLVLLAAIGALKLIDPAPLSTSVGKLIDPAPLSTSVG